MHVLHALHAFNALHALQMGIEPPSLEEWHRRAGHELGFVGSMGSMGSMGGIGGGGGAVPPQADYPAKVLSKDDLLVGRAAQRLTSRDNFTNAPTVCPICLDEFAPPDTDSHTDAHTGTHAGAGAGLLGDYASTPVQGAGATAAVTNETVGSQACGAGVAAGGEGGGGGGEEGGSGDSAVLAGGLRCGRQMLVATLPRCGHAFHLACIQVRAGGLNPLSANSSPTELTEWLSAAGRGGLAAGTRAQSAAAKLPES